jgi:hypothetical protein
VPSQYEIPQCLRHEITIKELHKLPKVATSAKTPGAVFHKEMMKEKAKRLIKVSTWLPDFKLTA